MNTIKIGMTAKDLINAKTSSTKLQTAPERINVRALAVMEDTDKDTGNMRPVGYLIAEDGTVYGTVSATAIDTVSAVAEAIENKELELPLTFKVALRTSGQGRNFITLSVE